MIAITKNPIVNYLLIPLRISPILTALRIAEKLVNALLPSLLVMAIALFVDNTGKSFYGTASIRQVLLPLLAIVSITIYQEINGAVINFVKEKHKSHMEEKLRLDLIKKRAELSYRYIEDNEAWELINRVCKAPVASVDEGFENLLRMAETIIKIVSLLFLLSTYVWWASLAIILLSIPLLLVSFLSGKMQYSAHVEAEKHGRRSEYFQKILMSREYVEERNLFGYIEQINGRWFDLYEKARKIRFRVQAKNETKMYSIAAVTGVVCTLMTCVLLSSVLSGAITLGLFIGFVNAAFQNVRSLTWDLSDGTKNLAKNMKYMHDFSAFLGLSGNEDSLTLPAPAESSHCEIEFCNVSFRYPGTDKYVLRDLSMKLSDGGHYAFVGVNGAGKTTITKLLTGLYEEYEGEILVNGRSLREYQPTYLKGMFATVYQDFSRYQISLRDNISFGGTVDISDEQITDVLRKVGLADLSSTLPKGYDSVLGKIDGGDNDLSGGQWQRIAISRALARNTPVTILDEPTAALDPMAENDVYTLFGEIQKGKTTIFITHRLGSARLADQIMVLDGGRIKEQGTHNDLLLAGGMYAEMFEQQRSWYF